LSRSFCTLLILALTNFSFFLSFLSAKHFSSVFPSFSQYLQYYLICLSLAIIVGFLLFGFHSATNFVKHFST
jgi:hypothetical protein